MNASWSEEGVKVSLKEEYAIEVHTHTTEEYVKRNVLNREGQRRLEEILAYHEFVIRTQPSRLLLDLSYEIDPAIIHDAYRICTTLLNYIENISYSERLEAHPEAQTVHRVILNETMEIFTEVMEQSGPHTPSGTAEA